MTEPKESGDGETFEPDRKPEIPRHVQYVTQVGKMCFLPGLYNVRYSWGIIDDGIAKWRLDAWDMSKGFHCRGGGGDKKIATLKKTKDPVNLPGICFSD